MGVLQNQIAEFIPYAFQVFAQMLELRVGHGLSTVYQNLLKPILSPSLWVVRGNVPALVGLLKSYLKVSPQECSACINPLLGCWQSAFATRSTESHSFELLNVLVTRLPFESFRVNFTHVIHLLLSSLADKTRCTPRFKRYFAIFMSHFVAKHGPTHIAIIVDSMQRNMFLQIMQDVWIPCFCFMISKVHRKVTLLAVAKLLCDRNVMSYKAVWINCVSAVADMAKSSIPTKPDDNNDFCGVDDRSYSAVHVDLNYFIHDYDAFPEVSDEDNQFAEAVRVSYELLKSDAGVLHILAASSIDLKNFLSSMGIPFI